MPDGEIIINTKLDDTQAQTELNRLTKQIQKMQQSLEEKSGKQNALAEEFETASSAAADTTAEVERLKGELERIKEITSGKLSVSPVETMEAYANQSQIAAELKQQEALLESQNKEADKLQKQYKDTAWSDIPSHRTL